MSRLCRLLRTLLALCAMVAYGLPAAAHISPAEAAMHSGATAATPCDHHGAEESEAPVKCPGHKEGTVSCCVAMCHAALPLPDIPAGWLVAPRVASEARTATLVTPAFISRLDRPPKPGIA
jgi:hypothetical protein